VDWTYSNTLASVYAELLVNGGTRRYNGVSGTGMFTGVLDHNYWPPLWGGTLELNF
jgi:hypothetical protein